MSGSSWSQTRVDGHRVIKPNRTGPVTSIVSFRMSVSSTRTSSRVSSYLPSTSVVRNDPRPNAAQIRAECSYQALSAYPATRLSTTGNRCCRHLRTATTIIPIRLAATSTAPGFNFDAPPPPPNRSAGSGRVDTQPGLVRSLPLEREPRAPGRARLVQTSRVP